MVFQVPVLGIGDVANAKQLFDFFPAFIGDRNGLVLLVYHEVASELLGLAGGGIEFLAFLQLGDDAVNAFVFVGGFFARSADDERGARFVNQDGVDFVDDGVVEASLNAILQVELHVVAQVIEAEFVVRAV